MTRYPHLAARIFNTPLLMHPAKLDAIIAGLGQRLLGLNDEVQLMARGLGVDPQAIAPEMFSTRKGERDDTRGYRIVDGVAVLGINGALVHRSKFLMADSSFLLGYNDMAADLEHAMDNPDVHAVLKVYDSPGGEVQGAFEYAQRVLDQRGRKPMKAIADGMMASAAYLGGSAADELAITSTGYAGSIGVVMRHVDFSRALQNDGVQVTHIFAGAHKIDGTPFAPLPDAVRAEFQTEVDDLYAMFVEAVARHTGLDPAAIRKTEAATYRGVAAVAAGLASRISTTDQLIAELAAKRSARSYGLPARATANDEEITMSGTAAPAGDPKQPALTQSDVDRARAEGHQAGVEAGATAERERVSGILTHAEAAGRTTLAHKCVSQGLSVEQAGELLAASPKLDQSTAADASQLYLAQVTAGNPSIKPDAAAPEGARALAASIVAAFQPSAARP